jgi:putative transposase
VPSSLPSPSKTDSTSNWQSSRGSGQLADQGIETALIDPDKPWRNGALERFNGKFRDECLGMEWFLSRTQAKVVLEAWRRHFNKVRPHSSLGYLTPAEFAAKPQHTNAALASATGGGAARCGGTAPWPVATPSLKGQSNDQETPVLPT